MNPGYANNASVGAQAVPQQPIPGALTALDKATERLHQALNNLEQRLGAVLSVPPPAGVEENNKLARHSLALQIDAGAASVNNAANHVEFITSRLEL